MAISFDITAATRTGQARAIFEAVASGIDEPVVLTTLSGADLCVLGQMSWTALATSWNRLQPEEQGKIIEARATQMIERGLLLEEEVPGLRYDPLAYYAVAPKLGIALAARANPTYIVTCTFSANQAPLSLFAVGDVTVPVRGIVMEVPSLIPGKEKETLSWGPLSWQFNHLLVTPEFAAEYLAEWTLRTAPSNAFRKKTPRTVALFRPGGGPAPIAELSVLGNGTTARVSGAGILDKQALRTMLLDLFAQGMPSSSQ